MAFWDVMPCTPNYKASHPKDCNFDIHCHENFKPHTNYTCHFMHSLYVCLKGKHGTWKSHLCTSSPKQVIHYKAGVRGQLQCPHCKWIDNWLRSAGQQDFWSSVVGQLKRPLIKCYSFNKIISKSGKPETYSLFVLTLWTSPYVHANYSKKCCNAVLYCN
jgi:hypothetical protein